MPRLPRVLIPLACALLMLAASGAAAQGFRGICARDQQDAIAVGDGGEVYRTLDGGNTWTERVLGSPLLELREVASRGFTFVIVGEAGAIWKSTDSGGNWTQTTIAGNPFLRGLSMPSDSTWFASGSSGVVVRTRNAGATWTTLATGTGAALYTATFTDAMHGWVAGDGGVLLGTSDGGDSWDPVSLGTSNRLISVAQRAATVWVVGLEGTAFRSTNGGAGFSPVNLKLDARADVRVVHMRSPDTLWIAGGGGFIRYSTNGGTTWTFQQHSMHGQISDLSSFGPGVFACSNANRALIASSDRGTTWHLATGATLSRSWGAGPRTSWGGNTRGNTFALNPINKNTIYCAQGNKVLASHDDGDSWNIIASFPLNYTKCNAFVVSPKDSNVWLAAIGGGSVSDRVYRTENRGADWTQELQMDFGEYGIPLEVDPDHPDTVWFGGELGAAGTTQTPLKRSTDFGQNWSSVGNAIFRSPCDIVVVPDSTEVMIVGDGVTSTGRGRHLKSTDGGQSFTVIDSVSNASEVPGLACARLRNSQVLATAWTAGGVQRSTNFGSAWSTVDATNQPWGVDISRDDPNMVVFGQYSANGDPAVLVSLNGGVTWTTISTATGFGNNYGLYARDRATVLAMQSSGIWKLQHIYSYTPAAGTQSVSVAAPNGGESWAPTTVHTITWNSAYVALARIEYRRAPGEPWQKIADVAGYLGKYDWTVPWDGTTQAKVRVTDAWDSSPQDSSNAVFTIPAPRLIETPVALDHGTQNAGTSTVLPLTLKNGGSTILHVTAIGTGTGVYAVGRTGMTLAAGQQDTVGVWFMPVYGGTYADTVTIVCDDPGHSPTRVPLTGIGNGPGFAAAPDTVRPPSVAVGSTSGAALTVTNTGNQPLSVTAIALSDQEFWVGRTSFSIPGGASDTVGVFYSPNAAGDDTASVVLTTSDAQSPHAVIAIGHGTVGLAVEAGAGYAFALAQNRPNPFSRATLVEYTLARDADVSLDVFDLRGRHVATLASGHMPAGRHDAVLGARVASEMPAGVYFVRMRAGTYTATRRILRIP